MISNKVLALAGLLVIASAVVHASDEKVKKGSIKTFISNHYGKALAAVGAIALGDLNRGIAFDGNKDFTFKDETYNIPLWFGAKYLRTKKLEEASFYNSFKLLTKTCQFIEAYRPI